MSKQNKLIRYFLLHFLIVVGIESYGQFIDHSILNSPIPTTPNAASILRNVEIPSNTYIGEVNLTIPIYELNGKDLSLPIYLSYKSSGFKVTETPSWVGMGWSLNSNGVIGRTIMDIPDEYANGYFSTDSKTYFNSFGPIMDSCENFDNGSIYEFYDRTNPNSLWEGIDTEPDLYTFSMPNGVSGKFVFDQNQQVRLTPKKNIKVSATGILNERIFNIWDDRGIGYSFLESEATETIQVTTLCDNLSGSQPVLAGVPISSWFITSMHSPKTNETIDFTYEQETTHKVTKSQARAVNYLVQSGTSHLPELNYDCTTTTDIYGVRPKAISFGSVTVDFIPDTRLDLSGGSRLKEIIVRNELDTLKRFVLYHSYLSVNQYLKLDSIVEFGRNGKRLPAHKFLYDEYHSPLKDNFDQDHWGFYNDAGNSILVPSYQLPSNFINFKGANREANFLAAKTGMLEKVIYPTGGFATLEYEPHTYSNFSEDQFDWRDLGATVIVNSSDPVVNGKHTEYYEFTIGEPTYVEVLGVQTCSDTGGGIPADCGLEILGVDVPGQFTILNETVGSFIYLPLAGTYRLYGYRPQINSPINEVIGQVIWKERRNQIYEKEGGGLRLKSIKHFDAISASPITTKKFEYKREDGVSSGKMMGSILYYHDITFSNGWICAGSGCCDMELQIVHRVLKSSSIQMGNTMGSAVGYDRVVEYLIDSNSQTNGKIVYEYSNYPDANRSIYPIVPIIETNHQKGMLLRKTEFDSNGLPLHEVRNVLKINPEIDLVYGFQAVRGVNMECRICDFIFSPYYHASTTVDIDSVIETTYSGNNALTKITKNEYEYISESPNKDGFHLLRNTRILSSSNGDQWTIKNKYPMDYAANDPIMDEMASKNIFEPITQIVVDSNNKVFDGKITTFSKVISPLNYTRFLPDRIYSMDLEVPIEYSLVSGMTSIYPPSSYFKEKVNYQYNPEGDLTLVSKPNDISTSFKWLDDYSTLGRVPIAKIDNASQGHIYHTSFEKTGTIGTSQSDSRTGNRYFNGSSYTIPVAERPTGSNLKMTFWYYTSAGGWQFQSEIAYSATVSKSGATRLDEVRVYPPGSQMSTYTYDPGIGMTSMTDANNVTTYYEYDSFGRLKLIRDKDNNILKTFEYHYRQNSQPAN